MTGRRTPQSTPFASSVLIWTADLSFKDRVWALRDSLLMESVMGLRSISRLVSGCRCSRAYTTALETLLVRNSPISVAFCF